VRGRRRKLAAEREGRLEQDFAEQDAPTSALSYGAASGTLWYGVTFAASKAVLFVSTLILTRLLSVQDFGLVALALLVMTYLDVIGDFGIGQAVIYHHGPRRDANTALSLASGAALLFAAAMFALAPAFAAFFAQPAATGMLRVLAVALVFDKIGMIPEATLRKDMNFTRRIGPELARAGLKGGLSITLAFAGLGAWSLIWGQLAGSIAATGGYLAICTWRLRPGFEPAMARRLLRFGLPVTLLGVFGAFIQNQDYFVIGRRLNATSLGYYTVAFRIPELLVLGFCFILSGVLFPAYAKVSTDAVTLRSGFLTTLRLAAVVNVAVAAWLCMLSPEIVTTLFGSKWTPSIPVAQVLAVYAAVYAIGFNVGDVYKATGRPGILNIISVVKIALTFPALWWAASRGIVSVALVMACAAAMFTCVELVVASRLLSAPLRQVFTQLLPAAGSAAVLVLATQVARLCITNAPTPLRLIVLTIVAATSYLAALSVLSHATFQRLWDLAAHVVRPRGRRLATTSGAQGSGSQVVVSAGERGSSAGGRDW
jgi:lipopolysaccharide exporter